MAEWLYEDGIGERRAALVIDDQIIEAAVERDSDGPRVGAVIAAKLVAYGAAGKGAVVTLDAPGSPTATLSGLPPSTAIGATLLVEISRMALAERGRVKPARVWMAGDDAQRDEGPDLRARIAATGVPVQVLASHDADRLEAAGWSEMLDAAHSGEVAFPGGMLLMSLTPAMTLIDIDGDGDSFGLAQAGAKAACAAIRCFGIGGSVGLDFPTLGSKSERNSVAEIVDANLPQPFERTAINGFGFLQIIRRRDRPSLIERVQFDRAKSAALVLLRQAERAVGAGALTLTASPPVAAVLEGQPAWLAALQSRTGRVVTLVADPACKGAGHAQ